MKVSNQILALLLICFLNFFTNNSFLKPDIMEARNLITAREMVEKGNWLNPTMNNYPRLAKPPLPTWINGIIATHVPVSNLSIHRIPSALAGVLLVLAIFFIAKNFSKDNNMPFVAAAISATSYYLILMARQATWDIYCHAFMTVAISFLVIAWKHKNNQYKWHLFSGIFMGLSFMSKGPVSFYALLLPFILSWLIFVDRSVFKEKWRGFLITCIVFLLIGLSWPIYQLLTNTDAILNTVNAETSAWNNRHVKPFYQYWGFWSHMGVWSALALVSFYFPYAKKRIPKLDYKLYLSWTLLVVILLSIPSEKKERYLIPVIVPLALLIGSYCCSLFRLWKEGNFPNSDYIILKIIASLLVVVSFGLPIFLYLKSPTNILFYLSLGVYLIFGGLFIFIVYRLNIKLLFFSMIALMTSISLLIIPQSRSITDNNSKYQSLAALKKHPIYKNHFYSQYLNPKQILELGKSVDTMKVVNNKFVLPNDKNVSILSNQILTTDSIQDKSRDLYFIDTLFYEPDDVNAKLYLYTLSKN